MFRNLSLKNQILFLSAIFGLIFFGLFLSSLSWTPMARAENESGNIQSRTSSEAETESEPVFEEIGFFSNKDLQNILNQNFFLVSEKEKFAFDLENYAVEKPVLVFRENSQPEIENINTCPIEPETGVFCSLTLSLSRRINLEKRAYLFLNKTEIENFLSSLNEKTQIKPENGRLEMTEEGKLKILKKSQNGKILNQNLSLEKILTNFKQSRIATSIQLASDDISPRISTDNLAALSIQEKIAHGESNFAGSPKNRIHNIHVAVGKFHGLVLAPDEEFSFVGYLGEVDEESGYKEELVIKKDETIPEFGGGVCQVSTTMFRTALNAGMEITARRNHAYPVQYYSPQGTDATVYVPSPDLKFKNDTGGYVLIQSTFNGTILSFDFYGASDGRQVEIIGPKVTERTEDGRLKTVLYQVVKDKNGNEIRKDTFKSNYDNPDKYH